MTDTLERTESTPAPARDLRVALLGNTNPDVYWATENEYRDAYQRLGLSVAAFMEGPQGFDDLTYALENGEHFDFVHWTRTKAFADAAGDARQWQMIAACRRRSIPLIGVHLDQFLALPSRVEQIKSDPYFRNVDIMFTVDGGHDDLWLDLGVNHRWLLPAISERWLGPGTPKPEWGSDVAFVGSWTGSYHREFAHRHELVDWLTRHFGDRVRFWPRRGEPRIVGRDLNDLYWSTKVVIGDAFHTPGSGGAPLARTGSDRTPETLGRGGLLLSPVVDGWNREEGDPFWVPGTFTWQMWDWNGLRQQIEYLFSISDDQRLAEREGAIWAITDRHTYSHRVQTIVDTLTEEGWL